MLDRPVARDDAGDGRLGLLLVGAGGAVASTVAAGLALIRAGSADRTGLPLAQVAGVGLAEYDAIEVAGWDLDPADLAAAAAHHRVLPEAMLGGVRDTLGAIRPWRAIGSSRVCRNIDGPNRIAANSLAAAVAQVRADIRGFAARTGIARMVMVNVASVESVPPASDVLGELGAFEQALHDNHEALSPAMMYAYAALCEGVPYGNFTPSRGAEIPALARLAEDRCVPVAGKDGKTGQTMLKTVIAPAFRDRALHVDGWFSTNLLGNRDGLALDDPGSLESKLRTKGSVLEDILGYTVEDHVLHIHYYKPRGDDKEAWDNIDLGGFLGQRMQLKINFLCKDSVLAAPLVIELARCLDLAARRGERGAQVQLGSFFKAPMSRPGVAPENDFFRQQEALMAWLTRADDAPVDAGAAAVRVPA